jgi:ferredoxin
LRSRLLRWVPALAFFYMFLWPAAYRLWIGDDFGIHGAEFTTSEFWSTFPGWGIGVLTLLICGFAAVYFLGAKGFCTYACPYGAIFAAAEKVSSLRIRVTDACQGCAHCTAVCSSNVRVHEEVRDFGMVVDSGCMKCLDCVSVCPNDALYYGAGPIPWLAKQPPRPGARGQERLPWREEGFLAVAFAVAFFTFRGLYGLVPFLMSLGLAGVLAYGVLLAVRLAGRRDFGWRHLALRRGGRLRPAGWAAAGLLGALLAFWTHSAAVRAAAWNGERPRLRRSAAAAPRRRQAAAASRPGGPPASRERDPLAAPSRDVGTGPHPGQRRAPRPAVAPRGRSAVRPSGARSGRERRGGAASARRRLTSTSAPSPPTPRSARRTSPWASFSPRAVTSKPPRRPSRAAAGRFPTLPT